MFNNVRFTPIILFALVALSFGATYHYYSKSEKLELQYNNAKTDLQKSIFSHLLYISLSNTFSKISSDAQKEKDALIIKNKDLRNEISKLLNKPENFNDYVDLRVSYRLLDATCDLRANAMSRSGQKFNRATDCPNPESRLSYNNAILYIIDLLEIVERSNIDRKAVSDAQDELIKLNKINSEKLVN